MIVKMGREPPPRTNLGGTRKLRWKRSIRSLNHGVSRLTVAGAANPSGVKVSLTVGGGDASQVVRHPAVDFLRI